MHKAAIRTQILTAAILLVITNFAYCHEPRQWSDKTGRLKVNATLVDLTENTVRIMRTDGKIVDVPIERLSAADQAYIRDVVDGRSSKSESFADKTSIPSEPVGVVKKASSGANRRNEMQAEIPDSVIDVVDDANELEIGNLQEHVLRENISSAATFNNSTAKPTIVGTSNHIAIVCAASSWIVLALATSYIAFVRFHRTWLWLLIGLVLPIISLVLILRKKIDTAGECDMHSWLHGNRCDLLKPNAIAFKPYQIPRLVAKSGELETAKNFLVRAKAELQHPYDWNLCHTCAAKIGIAKVDYFLAKCRFRYNDLIQTYPILVTLEEFIKGPQPRWAVENEAESIDAIQVALKLDESGPVANESLLTPNSFKLGNTLERKAMETALLNAELKYIQKASAELIANRIETDARSRAIAAKAKKYSQGTNGLGKFGAAVLMGAATGNIDFGVAYAGNLKGKNQTRRRLEHQSYTSKHEAKMIRKRADKLSRRGDNLRSLASSSGTLMNIVRRWGAMLPLMVLFLGGTGVLTAFILSFFITVLTVMSFLPSLIVSASAAILLNIPVIYYLFPRLLEIRDVIKTYPDIGINTLNTDDKD